MENKVTETKPEKNLSVSMINKKLFFVIALFIVIFVFIIVSLSYIVPGLSLNKALENTNNLASLSFEQATFENNTGELIYKTSGDFLFPNKLRVYTTPEIENTETIIIDNSVYSKWLDNWFTIKSNDTSEFDIADPRKYLSLLSNISSIRNAGKNEIMGQKMSLVGFDLNESNALDFITKSEEGAHYKGEAWIGKSDGLIHRIAITFIPDDKNEVTMKYQMDFSDFNGNVIIEEPKI